MADYTNENGLMQPLVSWLKTTRRLRADTVLVSELSWFGRKVDLATLTRSRCMTAYELKLNSTKRAIAQAAYNQLVFDRTFIVTAVVPTERNLAMAAQAGVGVIYVNGKGPKIMLASGRSHPHPVLRRRLLKAIRGVAHVW
jgi:hypothetical protein